MLTYLKSYEGKLKTFLVLLVLFLAVAIYLSFHVLVVGRNAIQEEVRRRVALRAEEVASELLVDEAALPVPSEAIIPSRFSQSQFARIAREQGLAALELLDPSGRVLVSSQVGRVGSEDREWTGLSATQKKRVELGETLLSGVPTGIEIAYATMSGYRAVWDAGGGLSGVLRVEDRAENVARVERNLKLLAALQGGGLAALLVLVFFFAQWLLAPYRRLAATADQARVLEGPPEKGKGEPDLLVASFQTVLEKLRHQEQELQRLRSPMGARADGDFPAEALARNLSSGMITFDKEGRVRMANPVALKILDRRGSEIEGQTYQEFLGNETDLGRLVQESLESGTPRSREMATYRTPRGKEIHLGLGLSPLTGRAGETEGVICLLSDLTEIRHLRERVALKEDLARLGELSAGIAHEFRNALATILGYARLLARRAEGEQREMTEALVREARGITKVVDDFLRFARPTRLELSEVDLESMLAHLAEEFSSCREARPIRVELEGEFPSLVADESLLKQAFHNLVRNAVESGGDRVILRGATEPDETLRIEVVDEGPGIAAEDLPRIFTPFFTTRPGGTGLGLPLVQKTIVSHDGTIEVDSRPGKGTRFLIRLPQRSSGPTALSL